MRAILLLALVTACDAASPDPGYGAALQIPGAQFRPGPFPAPTGGPEALAVTTTHAMVPIGHIGERLKGTLDSTAHAAIIGIEGDDGTWIVRAGPPDLDAPGLATVSATFGLADATEPGPVLLEVAAVDAQGHIGAAAEVAVIATADGPIDGDLVVSLEWSSTADLDLHVTDPHGDEAWSGHPNTWQSPPPGEPVDPDAWLVGGILDHDGNRLCHRDAAPSEHVIWTTRTNSLGQPVAPVLPSGDYVVRVDTRSLCKDASTAWSVTAYTQGGVVLGAARGVSTAADVIQGHGAGAGVTALHFARP